MIGYLKRHVCMDSDCKVWLHLCREMQTVTLVFLFIWMPTFLGLTGSQDEAGDGADDVASQSELLTVKSEIKQDIASVKSEIKQDIASVKSEMASVKSEMEQSFANVNDKMNMLLQMMQNITKPQGGIDAVCYIRETLICAKILRLR